MGGSDNVEDKNVQGQPPSGLAPNHSDEPTTVETEEKNQTKQGKQSYSPPKLTCYGTIEDLTRAKGIRGHADGGVNPRANKSAF